MSADLVATTIGQEAEELPELDYFSEDEEDDLREKRDQRQLVHARREWYARAFTSLEVEVDPQEIVLCHQEHTFHHLITNTSSFPVVCRLLSTANGFLRVCDAASFVIEPLGVYPIRVKKTAGWGAGRTELVVLQVLPVDWDFQRQKMWEMSAKLLFGLGRKPVDYKIRYRRSPAYANHVAEVLKDFKDDSGKISALLDRTDYKINCNQFAILEACVQTIERKETQKEKKRKRC